MGGHARAVSSSALPHASLAQDQGPLHLAIIVTLTLIALVIYSLRVFTRVRLLRSFGLDDVFMFLSAVCSTTRLQKYYTADSLYAVMRGRHFHRIYRFSGARSGATTWRRHIVS